MSEYQSYELVALDRPLTEAQMASLRAVSTRAEITPTRRDSSRRPLFETSGTSSVLASAPARLHESQRKSPHAP